MRTMVAMSGGVDSSAAAALAVAAGHEVVGVTLRLWGGDNDSGCCAVSDVDDARRVADHLGVDHYVFGLADEFEATVVNPYVDGHRRGETPNPCVECNRHIKLGVLADRARRMGFDRLVTGHHARVIDTAAGRRLARGLDTAKDQSYVLAMATAADLELLWLPVGEMTKDDVRRMAADAGLRTADKPDSQDVCFIGRAEGRARFLAGRTEPRPARVVDEGGRQVGTVPDATLVTVGQRKGLGPIGDGRRAFVRDVDLAGGVVTVGDRASLDCSAQGLRDVTMVGGGRPDGPVLVQWRAHGSVAAATIDGDRLTWDEPQPRVAAGQLVAFYDPTEPDVVIGSATATATVDWA